MDKRGFFDLLKRIAAVMLCAFISFAYMPVMAFAETEPQGKKEPEVVTDAAEGTHDQEGTAAQDENSAQSKDPAGDGDTGNNVEPDALNTDNDTDNEATSVEIENAPEKTAKPDGELKDSDELLWDYLNKGIAEETGNKSKGAGKLRSKSAPRVNQLTEYEQTVYYSLKDQIEQLMQPEEGEASAETVFTVPASLILDRVITSDGVENGPDTLTVYKISDEEFKLLTKDIDGSKIIKALMADMPYELFWFDKTRNYSYGISPNGYYSVSGDTYLVDDPEYPVDEPGLKFTLKVSRDYSVDNKLNTTSLDNSKIERVNTAIETAGGIINDASGNSFEILSTYKDAICDLTEYDHDAVDNNRDYGDPWQMISVFDGEDEGTNVVCEGYSKAFQYLCDNTEELEEDGIDCVSVTGTMRGGTGEGRHMWNIVHMDDGRNYIADITNCDGEDGGQDNSIGYPDRLFLTGAMEGGSVAEGYGFDVDEDQDADVTYTYDDNTTALYTADELTLSVSDYEYSDTGEDDSDEAIIIENSDDIYTVYSDGDLAVDVLADLDKYDLSKGYQLNITVGKGKEIYDEENGYSYSLDGEPFSDNTYYEVKDSDNNNGKRVTLKGQALAGDGIEAVVIQATITEKGKPDVLESGCESFEVDEASDTIYNLDDLSVSAGTPFCLYKEGAYFSIYNTSCPNGLDGRCVITEASVKTAESEEGVIELSENQDENMYWFEAKKEGTATISLELYRYRYTYDEKMNQGEEYFDTISKDIKVYVSDTAFSVIGEDEVFPEDSSEYAVQATREGEALSEDELKGFDYEWSITGGKEYAEIQADKNDSSRATLTTDDVGSEYHVEMSLTVSKGSKVIAKVKKHIGVVDTKYVPEIKDSKGKAIDPNRFYLDPGEDTQITVRLLKYTKGQTEPAEATDVKYKWSSCTQGTISIINGDDEQVAPVSWDEENYDYTYDNEYTIDAEGKGARFTIKRLTEDDINLSLDAIVPEGEDNYKNIYVSFLYSGHSTYELKWAQYEANPGDEVELTASALYRVVYDENGKVVRRKEADASDYSWTIGPESSDLAYFTGGNDGSSASGKTATLKISDQIDFGDDSYKELVVKLRATAPDGNVYEAGHQVFVTKKNPEVVLSDFSVDDEPLLSPLTGQKKKVKGLSEKATIRFNVTVNEEDAEATIKEIDYCIASDKGDEEDGNVYAEYRTGTKSTEVVITRPFPSYGEWHIDTVVVTLANGKRAKFKDINAISSSVEPGNGYAKMEMWEDTALDVVPDDETPADEEAPVISSYSVDKKSRQYEPRETIKVSLKISDASDLRTVAMHLNTPTGGEINCDGFVDGKEYDKKTGLYTVTLRTSETGSYSIMFIDVSDVFGNKASYYNSNYTSYIDNADDDNVHTGVDMSGADFEVVGSISGDATAPVIDKESLTSAGKKIEINSGLNYIRCKISDDSEIPEGRVAMSFASDSLENSWYTIQGTPVDDEAEEGWYQFEMPSDYYGTWRVQGIFAEDKYGNGSWWANKSAIKKNVVLSDFPYTGNIDYDDGDKLNALTYMCGKLDDDTGIFVSGNGLAKNAVLDAYEIKNTNDSYSGIMQKLDTDDSNNGTLYEIGMSIENGSYNKEGENIKVLLPNDDEKYKDGMVRISHLIDEDTVQVCYARIEDGSALITVDSLSPFLIEPATEQEAEEHAGDDSYKEPAVFVPGSEYEDNHRSWSSISGLSFITGDKVRILNEVSNEYEVYSYDKEKGGFYSGDKRADVSAQLDLGDAKTPDNGTSYNVNVYLNGYPIAVKGDLTYVQNCTHGSAIEKIDGRPATCREEGVIEHYECSVCHRAFTDETGETEFTGPTKIEKGAHTFGDVIAGKAATCTEDGVRAHYECSVCHGLFVKDGGHYVSKTEDELKIPAGHKYGSLIPEQAANCTEDGVRAHYECSGCSKMFVKEDGNYVEKTADELKIPAGHKYGNEIAQVDATCTKDGVKAHYECSVCHELFVKDGESYISKTEDELKIASEGHKYGSEIAQVDATCTEDGVKAHYECSVCHAKFIKDGENYVGKTEAELKIPAGHKYGSEIAQVDATCTEDGVKAHYECSVCHGLFVKDGENYVSKMENELKIPAGHKYGSEIAQVDATCTEDGVKAHYECSVCHAKFIKDGENYVGKTEDELKIPAGHKYGNEIAQVDATCTKDGVKAHYECSVCHGLFVKDGENYVSKTENELKIPAGHKYGSEIAQVDATCTEDGVKAHYECSVCHGLFVKDGENYVSKTEDELKIPAGHIKVHHPEVAAGENTDGNIEYWTCSRCGKYFSNEAMTNEISQSDTVILSQEKVLQNAKDQAKRELDQIDRSQYSGSELAAVEKAISDAKAAIDSANSVADVNSAKQAATQTVGAQKTNAQKDSDARNAAAAELANAKTNAWNELNRVSLGKYKEPELSKVRTAIANGRRSIDAAGSIAAVNSAKNSALNTINKQAKYNGKLPRVSIVNPAKGSKSFTAKWKKLSKANQKKVTGIEIQYAMNKNFTKNAKIVTAKKATVSKKIGKLAKKKNYWVRVRTYQTKKGVKTVGAWSKVRTIKTN